MEASQECGKRVLVVIPAYNRPVELAHLLASLQTLERAALEWSIVIVDDGSAVPVATQLEGHFPDLPLTVVRNESNRGPAYSRNRGASSDTSDYLWFLDSDTEVCNSRMLHAMVAALEANPSSIGAVGGVLEDFDGSRRLLQLTFQYNGTFLYRAIEPDDASHPDGLSSANLFLRREVFEAAGGFCQDLPRDEDNDLCMTLAEMGYSCYQDPDTVVLNKITDSGRDGGAFAHFADPRKYVGDLLDTRLALLARHFPGRLPVLWLLDLVEIPRIWVQKKRGRFVTNRFNKAIPRLTPRLLVYAAVKLCTGYYRGVRYFLGRRSATLRGARGAVAGRV